MGWIADLLKEIPSAARYKSELEEMERENTKLKQKVLSLESENNNLRQEIQRRNDVIQKVESHGAPLEEIKINILVFMSKHEEVYTQHIASALKIGLQAAQFHLEELQDAALISSCAFMENETSWYLAQGGRKYLVRNKLIT